VSRFMTDKSWKLNQALPEDKEPDLVTVNRGDEVFEFNPDSEDVDELIVTGSGGVFVLIEDSGGEDLIYRYPPSSVAEIVYENTGYERPEDEEEGDSDDE